jgi:hypothetical protein
MDNEAAKQLCHSLVAADSEQGVIDLLTDAGLWEDASSWRYYGDYENNYNTIGNQQSRPDAALVEKLVNSVDDSVKQNAQTVARAELASLQFGQELSRKIREHCAEDCGGSKLRNLFCVHRLNHALALLTQASYTMPRLCVCRELISVLFWLELQMWLRN